MDSVPCTTLFFAAMGVEADQAQSVELYPQPSSVNFVPDDSVIYTTSSTPTSYRPQTRFGKILLADAIVLLVRENQTYILIETHNTSRF